MSEQATAAAEEIQSKFSLFNQQTTIGRQYLDEIAAIIDAAFAGVVAERDEILRECRHLLWHHGHGEGTRKRIDSLIGKDEDES